MAELNNNHGRGEDELNQFIERLTERLTKILGISIEKEIAKRIDQLRIEYKRDEQQAINTGITAHVEEKVKEWVCPRIPSWINSDHLTILGLFGVVVCAAGFILGSYNRWYIFLVILGLFLNWFGDSFDGSLARYRKKTRPNYGYYIDHVVDALAILIFSIGLGVSLYVRIDIALLFAAMYMALMVHVELITYVENEFKYSFGLVGPTEIRILGVFAVIAMFFSPIKYYNILGQYVSQYDAAFLIVSILMGLLLLYSLITKGIELDKKDRANWK